MILNEKNRDRAGKGKISVPSLRIFQFSSKFLVPHFLEIDLNLLQNFSKYLQNT